MKSSYNEKQLQFLRDLAHEIGEKDNIHKAERIALAIFKAIRDLQDDDQLNSFHEYLPKHVDVFLPRNGGRDQEMPEVVSINNFIGEIMKEDGPAAVDDFYSEEKTLMIVKDFFRVLSQCCSENENIQIESILPGAVGDLWAETVYA